MLRNDYVMDITPVVLSSSELLVNGNEYQLESNDNEMKLQHFKRTGKLGRHLGKGYLSSNKNKNFCL